MWILILYIGVAVIPSQVPGGGPTSAEFSTQSACQSALAQAQANFGEERPFDFRFQQDGGASRFWTVKGVCVPK